MVQASKFFAQKQFLSHAEGEFYKKKKDLINERHAAASLGVVLCLTLVGCGIIFGVIPAPTKTRYASVTFDAFPSDEQLDKAFPAGMRPTCRDETAYPLAMDSSSIFQGLEVRKMFLDPRKVANLLMYNATCSIELSPDETFANVREKASFRDFQGLSMTPMVNNMVCQTPGGEITAKLKLGLKSTADYFGEMMRQVVETTNARTDNDTPLLRFKGSQALSMVIEDWTPGMVIIEAYVGQTASTNHVEAGIAPHIMVYCGVDQMSSPQRRRRLSSSCASSCTLQGTTQTCREWALYIQMSESKSEDDAITQVGQWCWGQCSCSSSDKPLSSSSSSSAPSPTSPPPPSNPTTTGSTATGSPTTPTSATSSPCESSCTLQGTSHTCREWALYIQMSEGKSEDEAITQVGQWCWGQCSCSSSDKPLSPSAAASTTTPPTNPTNPTTTGSTATGSPTTPTSATSSPCESSCTLQGTTQTCREWALYIQMSEGKSEDEAITQVGQWCWGQCSCSSSDKPLSSSSSSSSAPSPTPGASSSSSSSSSSGVQNCLGACVLHGSATTCVEMALYYVNEGGQTEDEAIATTNAACASQCLCSAADKPLAALSGNVTSASRSFCDNTCVAGGYTTTCRAMVVHGLSEGLTQAAAIAQGNSWCMGYCACGDADAPFDVQYHTPSNQSSATSNNGTAGDCNANCTQHGHTYPCATFLQYYVGDQQMGAAAARDEVNTACAGQCSCTTDDAETAAAQHGGGGGGGGSGANAGSSGSGGTPADRLCTTLTKGVGRVGPNGKNCITKMVARDCSSNTLSAATAQSMLGSGAAFMDPAFGMVVCRDPNDLSMVGAIDEFHEEITVNFDADKRPEQLAEMLCPNASFPMFDVISVFESRTLMPKQRERMREEIRDELRVRLVIPKYTVRCQGEDEEYAGFSEHFSDLYPWVQMLITLVIFKGAHYVYNVLSFCTRHRGKSAAVQPVAAASGGGRTSADDAGRGGDDGGGELSGPRARITLVEEFDDRKSSESSDGGDGEEKRGANVERAVDADTMQAGAMMTVIGVTAAAAAHSALHEFETG